MKTKLLFTSLFLASLQSFFAQTAKADSVKTTIPAKVEKEIMVNSKDSKEKEMLEEKLKAEKTALKEAENREKEQKKLEKDKRNFEKKQEKIADQEKDLLKTKDKLKEANEDLIKNTAKFQDKKSRGKLNDIEIEKENIKISKQQIKIKEIEEDIVKIEKKLNKSRG
jgi:uncharacterized protein (DUF3084 family)